MTESQVDAEAVITSLTRRCAALIQEAAVLEAMLAVERERVAALSALKNE